MMTPWLKPCMYMWECGMCLKLTFPIYLQVPPVFHYFFPLSLAGRAHPLGMWDATFKLVFINILARLDFSLTLLSPHHTHTNILTYTCVCPA